VDAWWNKRAEADGSKDDYSGGTAAAEGEGHARQQRWKRSVGLSDFGKVTGAYLMFLSHQSPSYIALYVI
jgi:hypothetical protein